MTTKVAVVFHSRGGRTRALAQSVLAGASSIGGVEATLIDVDELENRDHWLALATADAIIFGTPTFMGSVSAPFKAFMDATFDVWIVQGWRDKLAAGFTNSSAASGDKLNTLVQLAVFAAQHGMIWVGLGLHPSYAGGRASGADINRLGSHLGAMAQSNIGEGPETAPPKGDRETGFHLGKRVALAARRWKRGDDRDANEGRHPTARTWAFPPPRTSTLQRTNLRELMARPDRFEHHLLVVARVGSTQLEVVTASEPLAFAHLNRSDEYALALPTGDALIDGFPLRTFLADPSSNADVGRINHGVGDLVLHPFGYLHWPGRMRAPFEPYPFAPGMRRTGVSMVFCACEDTEPTERPLFVSEGRDVKAYASPAPPFMVCDTAHEEGRVVATIDEVAMTLLVAPKTIHAPHGAYVLVLEASSPEWFATDLVFVPPGEELSGEGIARALVMASATVDASPPPPSWDAVPLPPFAPFENAEAGHLPIRHGELVLEDAGPRLVTARIGDHPAVEVPRHWLARMLFRVALHGYQLGYVETYGGVYWDDRAGMLLGVRGQGDVAVDANVIEALYRAVAPTGYRERVE